MDTGKLREMLNPINSPFPKASHAYSTFENAHGPMITTSPITIKWFTLEIYRHHAIKENGLSWSGLKTNALTLPIITIPLDRPIC